MRTNNFTGMFCLMVPAFAFVGLGEWNTPYAVDQEAAQGVEVVAVDQSDAVLSLSDWEFTTCCCEAGARPIDGLGSWRYTGGRQAYAGGGPQDRSATVRPVVNIYVINVNGGRRAFGSRNFANQNGNGQVQTVSVSRRPRQSRFQNIIALRRPGLFGNNGLGGGVNGAFDISNIFSTLVGRQAQAPGGLTVLGSGFDLANVFTAIVTQAADGSLSNSSVFLPVASTPASFGYDDGGFTVARRTRGGGDSRAKRLRRIND